MLNKYYLLFAFYIYLVDKVSCQCSSCADLTYLSCTICYDSCTPEQNKKFQKCSYTHCTNYFADSNNTKTCTKYQTVQLSEQECFIKCCQSSANYFSIQELNKCIDKNKQIMTTSIIVSIVVGAVFFIIILVCFLCCRSNINTLCNLGCCSRECCTFFCQRLCFVLRCRCLFHNPAPRSSRRNQNDSSSESSSRLESQILVDYLKWSSDQSIEIAEKDQSCPVCLVNGVNTLTICKHCYHLECIMEWYNRRKLCPLCKRLKIKNVKFFCQGCHRQYVNLNLQMHNDMEKIICQIKGPNCPKCQ